MYIEGAPSQVPLLILTNQSFNQILEDTSEFGGPGILVTRDLDIRGVTVTKIVKSTVVGQISTQLR